MSYSAMDVIEYVEENDVRFIRLAFCDMFGNLKNISIQPSELASVLEHGKGFDSFLITGLDDNDYPDLFLMPDPSTMEILPWRPSSGAVIRLYCDIVLEDGSPYIYDPRYFLKKAINECKKLNFDVYISFRSEFYVFKLDEDGNPTKIPYDEGGYLDVAPRDKCENIRREICFMLSDMGIKPQASHHEAGPGQNVISFEPASPLEAADNLITYKNVVENVCARNGAYACFDPKPLVDLPGNGLHIDIRTMRDGVNLIETEFEFCSSFMAGIMNRIREITVFTNCRVDSYDRFGLDEAPKYVTWSTQNRSRLLRVPVRNNIRQCFILRSPDCSINPYLVCAILIMAGIEGANLKEVLPPPLNVSSRLLNEDEMRTNDMLPASLEDAIALARTSEFLNKEEIGMIARHFIDAIENQ